jgi:hypothetical protein
MSAENENNTPRKRNKYIDIVGFILMLLSLLRYFGMPEKLGSSCLIFGIALMNRNIIFDFVAKVKSGQKLRLFSWTEGLFLFEVLVFCLYIYNMFFL